MLLLTNVHSRISWVSDKANFGKYDLKKENCNIYPSFTPKTSFYTNFCTKCKTSFQSSPFQPQAVFVCIKHSKQSVARAEWLFLLFNFMSIRVGVCVCVGGFLQKYGTCSDVLMWPCGLCVSLGAFSNMCLDDKMYSRDVRNTQGFNGFQISSLCWDVDMYSLRRKVRP